MIHKTWKSILVLVIVMFRGTYFCAEVNAIEMKIVPKLGSPIKIEMTPWLILISSDLRQNIIIAEERAISVEPGKRNNNFIEVHC